MSQKGEVEFLQALNPADYFTLVMDHEIRAAGLAGGIGAFALELKSVPDIAALQGRIEELFQRFPLAACRLRLKGRRYGWVAQNAGGPPLKRVKADPGEPWDPFVDSSLTAIMNRVEPWERTAPLTFYLLEGEGKGVFLLRWLHPLLDARGAELIFDFLTTEDGDRREVFGRPPCASLILSQLGRWTLWRKILYFVKAKRHINRIDRLKSTLPGTEDGQPLCMRFRVQRFDVGQSAAIARQAQRCVGLGGKSLYYIGCLMRAMEATGPAQPKEAYCAPYAFNLRKQRVLAPVIGNHVSVLFAQAPTGLLADRQSLFRHLRQQNADVIRNGIDYAFLPLMWLGQWLSPERYGRLLRRQSRGAERSSFWFSDVGDMRLGGRDFFGSSVEGLFYLCQVTAPPGLALLVGQMNGELTLSYCYLEPSLDSAWISRLQARMVQELMAEV